MNGTYLLKAHKCSETGETGLLFNDCPIIQYPMVALEGLLVAHDLLEHVNGLNKIGSIDDELEALGGVWFVRGELCDLNRGKPSYYSPDESLASDVLNMARIYNNGVNFKTDVPKLDRDHFFYETAVEIVEIAKNGVNSEIDDDERNQDRLDHYFDSAIAYMINGYDKADNKYNQANVNGLFWDIAAEVDRFLKEYELIEGAQFELIINDNGVRFVHKEDDFVITVYAFFNGECEEIQIVNYDNSPLIEWLENNDLDYYEDEIIGSIECGLSDHDIDDHDLSFEFEYAYVEAA